MLITVHRFFCAPFDTNLRGRIGSALLPFRATWHATLILRQVAQVPLPDPHARDFNTITALLRQRVARHLRIGVPSRSCTEKAPAGRRGDGGEGRGFRPETAERRMPVLVAVPVRSRTHTAFRRPGDIDLRGKLLRTQPPIGRRPRPGVADIRLRDEFILTTKCIRYMNRLPCSSKGVFSRRSLNAERGVASCGSGS